MPNAGLTTLGYDADMRVDSVKDATGDATYIDRDAVGRVDEVYHPFDDTRHILNRFSYDLHGNLSRKQTGLTAVRSGGAWGSTNTNELAETVTAFDQLDRPIKTTSRPLR